MIIKVYLLIFASLFLVFGFYQFLTGNQTILSNKLLQEYNLSHSFIKKHGILYMSIGCILLLVVFFYSRSGNIFALYTGFIILVISYCIELFLAIKNEKNIDGIPRKAVVKAGLLIVFSIIIVTYFRPVQLSDLLEDAETIQVSVQELGVDNSGTAYIDEPACTVLSSQEKEEIITAAEKYRYYRKLSSLLQYDRNKGFSNKILILYAEENAQIKTICITSMQEIIIENHSYAMANSWEFIDNVQSLLQYESKFPNS